MKNITTILLLSLSIVACEGPVGPQGDQGIQGNQGQIGSSGMSGITLVKFRIVSSDFVFNGTSEFIDKTVAEITQAVVDNGFVFGYLYSPVAGTTTPMPIVLPFAGSTVNLTFNYEVGSVSIRLISDTGILLGDVFNGNEVWIVVVEPQSGKRAPSKQAIDEWLKSQSL